ncbi:hypothetical protein Tco_0713450 [Tanacetum coccineum]
MESASSSTLDAAGASEIPKLKSVTQDPSVPTPSNPSEKRPTKRIEIEDSESTDKGDTPMQSIGKKKKGMVIDDSKKEDNCGSAECGTKKKDRMHSNKKRKLRCECNQHLYPNMFLVVYLAFRYTPDVE